MMIMILNVHVQRLSAYIPSSLAENTESRAHTHTNTALGVQNNKNNGDNSTHKKTTNNNII